MIRYLTAGESHGPALTAIVDGLPAGLPLTPEPINLQLRRRQQGYGRGHRMKIETDTVEFSQACASVKPSAHPSLCLFAMLIGKIGPKK